jgi:WXG100 family type VII secretion target
MLSERCAIRRFGLRTPCSRKSAFDGTETAAAASNIHIEHEGHERILMTTPGGGPLTTDFELMSAVASKTDSRNEEIRAMLQSFIGRMTSVSPSVWGGVAAVRFRDVVERWNAESTKLHAALQRIAETIRYNERTLREAGESHSQQIGSVATNL